MRITAQTVKENPVISTVAAAAISVTSILGGASALGINLIPWVSADEISRLKNENLTRDEAILQRLEQIDAAQRRMQKDQNALLRDYWQAKINEANDELKRSPNSRTAQRQRAEAEHAIQEIDANDKAQSK
jgi:hypothetical protein